MFTSRTRRKPLGQSLVEVAILMPVLLIMLSGLIEFGFALNQYLNLLDGARDGARFGSDGDPTQRASCTNTSDDDNDKVVNDCPAPGIGVNGNYPDDALNCDADPGTGEVTLDYYMQIACVVTRSLTQSVTLDPARDDVVISIYRVYNDPLDPGAYILGQLPDYTQNPDLSAHNPTTNTVPGQWRLYGHYTSRFTQSDIQNRLDPDSPGAGVLVVEVFYNYHHILGLPWITQFVPNPLLFHTFTIIPVPAA